jgi:anti-anti-sigma regulatory factor
MLSGDPEVILMNTHLLESDVLFVALPAEPRLGPELALLRERVTREPDLHLILDASRLEIITSPNLGQLLFLRRLLTERHRRLILCNVRLATRCMFRVAGLDTFFEYAQDKAEALNAVRQPVGATVENG